jgi:hypothetical protein
MGQYKNPRVFYNHMLHNNHLLEQVQNPMNQITQAPNLYIFLPQNLGFDAQLKYKTFR